MFITKKIFCNWFFRNFIINFFSIVYYLLFSLLFIPYFEYAQCIGPLTFNCDNNRTNSAVIMDTQPNKEFYFDTFGKYSGGLTYNGSTILKVKVASNPSPPSTCQWKLVMIISNGGSLVTPVSSEWETLATYGSGSISSKPTLDHLLVRVSNGCGTPQNSGVWKQFNPADGDIIEIINPNFLSPAGLCNGSQTNGVGTYLGVNYNEYSFIVDYRIVPELEHTPGRYELSIKFCLVEK